MAELKTIDGMQINHDIAHHRREWRLQRVGWLLMALVLAAALAGLLGPGPLSHASAGGPGAPVRVDYDRFGRIEAPARLRIRLAPGVASGGTVHLRLGRDFVENVDIQRIYPEPGSTRAGRDEFDYELRTAPTPDATIIDVHYQAERFGTLPVRVGIGDARPVAFSQWVYP